MTTRETGLWMATAWAIAVVVLVKVLCWRHGLLAASIPGWAVALFGSLAAAIEESPKLWALAISGAWLATLVLMVAVFS